MERLTVSIERVHVERVESKGMTEEERKESDRLARYYAHGIDDPMHVSMDRDLRSAARDLRFQERMKAEPVTPKLLRKERARGWMDEGELNQYIVEGEDD